jgi:hypothetical protein
MRGAPEQVAAEPSLVDGPLVPPSQRRAYLRRRLLTSPTQAAPVVGRYGLAAVRLRADAC